MSAHASHRPSRSLAAALVLVAALGGLAFALLGGSNAGARGGIVHVGTARNAHLGVRVLVTSRGRTLYTLSAEVHGRFICTSRSCLALWKPLVLPHDDRAVGVAHLGAIRRPDGRRQATYRGHPLYTFAQDARKGDAKGEGFRDVGTWHAARAPRSKPASAPAPSGGFGY